MERPALRDVVWFLVRWFLKLLPLLLVAAFLHFYLPGHDVVRVVGTEVTRSDKTAKGITSEGAATVVTRDVRYINAVRENGDPAVYRNEDTRWGFPWYFKFQSGNLQAVAQDLVSTGAEPRWVLVTHYGWRIEILSMFPNAVAIEPVEGPDVTVIPWFNIVFLVVLAVVLIVIWQAWRRLMLRLALDERFENASNGVVQIWRWFKASLRDLRERATGG